MGTCRRGAIGSDQATALSCVPAPRIHVTLHFFGELDRAAVAALPSVLGDAVPEAPFHVELGAGGTFPPAGRPRVLWLRLSAGNEAIARLHAWIAPRVVGVGQPDRHGAFSPHVTIARVRRDPQPGLGGMLRAAAARTPAPSGRARVDAVTLFESVASANGPTYVPVAQLPLVGGPALR